MRLEKPSKKRVERYRKGRRPNTRRQSERKTLILTFMIPIEFLLTWRHGHLTLLKSKRRQNFYYVIHPVPSPVISTK